MTMELSTQMVQFGLKYQKDIVDIISCVLVTFITKYQYFIKMFCSLILTAAICLQLLMMKQYVS